MVIIPPHYATGDPVKNRRPQRSRSRKKWTDSKRPPTRNPAPPILVDAEPQANGLTTWRAGGPGVEKLNGRRLFSSPASAVEAVASILPERHVILCPATRKDRKEAAEAASAAAKASLGPYPIWVEERRGYATAWAIHWPRTANGRRRTTSAGSLKRAYRKIHEREPRAAVRIVIESKKGRAEVAALPADANTLVREYLPSHMI